MSERQREQILARVQTAPPEERGRIIIALWCHATAFTVVTGGLAASLAFSAARIWKRRDQGLARAVRAGGYWPAVAGFAIASVGTQAIGKSIVDRIVNDSVARPAPHHPGPDD